MTVLADACIAAAGGALIACAFPLFRKVARMVRAVMDEAANPDVFN